MLFLCVLNKFQPQRPQLKTTPQRLQKCEKNNYSPQLQINSKFLTFIWILAGKLLGNPEKNLILISSRHVSSDLNIQKGLLYAI